MSDTVVPEPITEADPPSVPPPPRLPVAQASTKLAAAVVDDSGRMLGRGRVPSPTDPDPELLYEALLACAAAALRGADVLPGDLDGIGVAAAGPMVWPSGEVSPLNMPAWRGFPLRKRLAEEFAEFLTLRAYAVLE